MTKLSFTLLGQYLNKEAAVPIDPGHYNFKIPKGLGKPAMLLATGAGLGIAGNNALNDMRLGSQIRKQQS